MLVNSYIFADFDPGKVDEILDRLPVIKVERGQTIIREGDSNKTVYLIESGELAVTKDSAGAEPVRVATLGAGDCFGDMTALAGGGVSASLTAETPAVLRPIVLAEIADEKIREKFILNISRILIKRLSTTNDLIIAKHEEKMRAMHRQISSSSFSTKSMIMLSFYIFILSLINKFSEYVPSASIVSSALILIFFGVNLHFVLKSGIPLAQYGMTANRLGSQALQGIVYSLPMLAVFIALKVWMTTIDPDRYHLFEPDRLERVGTTSMTVYVAVALSYALLSFAQEFIRCAVQRSLHLFAEASDDGSSKTGWQAMLVANIVFASLHMHLGPSFAAGAFIIGLFWGWMYLRTNSYLATAFSHALVGCIVIFVFGVPF